MSSAVAELENYLQSMLALKPPGVSGSKIRGIATLCTANVQNESVLIQKIFTHCKKAQGTHKLGVLYVVDSVTRQWADAARKAGQPPGNAAPDGTFAAGVNRVTELLPVLITDIINHAPYDQKEKIEKLIDIWERSQTFPAPMLSSFREELNAPGLNTFGGPAAPANGFAAAPDTLSILKALTDMAKTNTGALTLTQASAPVPVAALNHQGTQIQGAGFSPTPAPALANSYGALGGMAANPFAAMGAFSPNPLAAMMPQAGTPGMSDSNSLGQQLQLLQLLASQGSLQDQWSAAIQIYKVTNQMGSANPDQMPTIPGMPVPGAPAWGAPGAQGHASWDNRSSGGSRRRSRSPGWDRARRTASPPRCRDSFVYGDHGDSPGHRDDARGRRGNEPYRQCSPPGRRRRSPTLPQQDPNLPPRGPKLIEWDYSIGRGNMKVLSRTLFVGGVTSTESQLRDLFSKFGIVQSCIVNIDKRHAFIKMISRQDAVSARDGMELFRTGGMQLRTRWGVGFGPRDCNDYQTGVSVIPIERLTEADRKWMLTAEYGGTGGRPIESGMIVEEPDIEIGAGVSSKAISRRIATDTGGKRGPQSSRGQQRSFE